VEDREGKDEGDGEGEVKGVLAEILRGVREKRPLGGVGMGEKPWYLRGLVKELKDIGGRSWRQTRRKWQGWSKDHFRLRVEGRMVGEAEEEEAQDGWKRKELEEWVKRVLSGTTNQSASGTDGIGYKLVKAVVRTMLVKEIVVDLEEGTISKEW